jgi:hypothetical protein
LQFLNKELTAMTTFAKTLIACSLAIAPLAATAQSSDAAYCQALIKAYRTTVPETASPDAIVPTAIAKCNAGDTAAGIPVLEKALRDAKVTLPPRI